MFPVRASEGESRKERWADAFLDAHVIELDRADKSNWVTLGVAGLAIALMLTVGISWYAISFLTTDRDHLFMMGFAIMLAELGVAGWIYRGIQERVGDHVFAKAARIRVAALDKRFELKPSDLVYAAKQRDYGRLARHFATPRYAPVVVSAAPYR